MASQIGGPKRRRNSESGSKPASSGPKFSDLLQRFTSKFRSPSTEEKAAGGLSAKSGGCSKSPFAHKLHEKQLAAASLHSRRRRRTRQKWPGFGRGVIKNLLAMLLFMCVLKPSLAKHQQRLTPIQRRNSVQIEKRVVPSPQSRARAKIYRIILEEQEQILRERQMQPSRDSEGPPKAKWPADSAATSGVCS